MAVQDNLDCTFVTPGNKKLKNKALLRSDEC